MTYTEILNRLNAGESIDTIAEEMTNTLNRAKNEYNNTHNAKREAIANCINTFISTLNILEDNPNSSEDKKVAPNDETVTNLLKIYELSKKYASNPEDYFLKTFFHI